MVTNSTQNALKAAILQMLLQQAPVPIMPARAVGQGRGETGWGGCGTGWIQQQYARSYSLFTKSPCPSLHLSYRSEETLCGAEGLQSGKEKSLPLQISSTNTRS